MKTIKKILVPTDFSEPSLKGVEYGVDLARRFHAQLLLVSIIEPIEPMIAPSLFGEAPLDTAVYLAEERSAAGIKLATLAEKLRKRGIKVRTALSTGIAHVQIVEAAAALGADLIVIATHGRSGLPHFLLGSVAEKVMRSAACPVLTVRNDTPLPS